VTTRLPQYERQVNVAGASTFPRGAGDRRLYTARMDPAAIVAGAALALAGLGAGVVVGRRSHAADMEQAAREARTAQEALDRRERRAQEDRRVQDLILSTMQEGVLLLDGEQRTAFANDALRRHLGMRPDGLAQVFPIPARQAIEECARERITRSVEIELGTPTRWLRVVATPAGEGGSVLVVVTDVTEPRRLDAVRRDFVANASHELKTPAAAIQAAAETLRDAAADDPLAVARFSDQLERDARRLSRIVMDLLDLSRLETGSDGHHRVLLGSIAAEEVDRSREIAEGEGVSLDLMVSGEATGVLGSARDVGLLMRNLIDNAVRYTPSGGCVGVSVTIDGSDAVLVVADSGVGIPSKDLPRIFERFYRVDRARSRETGGTGLGLAIVKHVAENLGASVAVESELGSGSTFTVRIPLAT
jgi:signal transduction histidine kinase